MVVCRTDASAVLYVGITHLVAKRKAHDRKLVVLSRFSIKHAESFINIVIYQQISRNISRRINYANVLVKFGFT